MVGVQPEDRWDHPGEGSGLMANLRDIVSGKELPDWADQQVRDLREARIEARKWARSGNPARRAEGLQGVMDITDVIENIYKRARTAA